MLHNSVTLMLGTQRPGLAGHQTVANISRRFEINE